MIDVIDFNSNAALTPLQKRGGPFQLAKNAEKYIILTLIFGKFSGDIADRLHTGEGLQCPSPDPTSEGAHRLSSGKGTTIS